MNAACLPGDLAARRYLGALEQVKAAADSHRKACGLLVGNGADAAHRINQGWAFVAISSDTTMLAQAASAHLDQARRTNRPT